MKVASLVSALALACVCVGAPAVGAAQTTASADIPKAKVKAGYKVPRMADGKPELEGIWTNATTTRLDRPANFGDRLLLTPQELAQTENATVERNARQNKVTDQATIDNWKTAALQPDTTDECRSGSRGAACGYNAGWTDPGDRVMRVNGEPRTSMITFPANGRMPARAAGAGRGAGRAQIVESSEDGPASTRSGQNDNPEGRSLGERCIMSFGISSGPVMTPQLYNNTYKFVQTKDTVAIYVEMVHDVRIVRLNSSHRTDGLRPYMGDSIGWWDGDTLVVETINFHPLQNVRGAGPKLKVTERFTRVAPDRLHYGFKVEDPETWVQPWGGEYEFGATNSIHEYACHEGNYGLQNILAGARFEEQQAAAKDQRAAR
ncbi:MAG: hypothetical protein JWO33_1973 [Caulobacteraceae bacterium]|nr:hypothetical protein [Caulobacteraceae bacterium]